LWKSFLRVVDIPYNAIPIMPYKCLFTSFEWFHILAPSAEPGAQRPVQYMVPQYDCSRDMPVKPDPREFISQIEQESEHLFTAGEYAQARRMLRRFLRQKVTEAIRAELQLLVGKSYVDEGKWKKALENLQTAKKTAEKTRNHETLASTLNYIGDCYILKGNKSSAVKFFNQSLSVCRKQRLSGNILARNISDLAQIADMRGEYKKAIPQWNKAISIYQTLSASRNHAYALLNTAMLRSRLGNVREAIDDANNALSIITGLGPKTVRTDCMWLLGSLHAQMGKYGDCLDYMEKAALEAGALGGLELARAYISLTIVLIELGAFDRARQYAEEGLTVSRRLKWNRGIATYQGLLARVRLSEGDFVAALHYTREARKQFASSGHFLVEARILLYEAEAGINLLKLSEARNILQRVTSIATGTDDVLLKSNCALTEVLLLTARKKFEDSAAKKLNRFLKPLKRGWFCHYMKAGYHQADFLVTGGKLDQASRILEDLYAQIRTAADALPEKYRTLYHNSPTVKGIAKLVLELEMEKTLQLTSVDDAIAALEDVRDKARLEPAEPTGLPPASGVESEFVFRSNVINNVMGMIKKVAGTDMPVLLTGETGVGKEMLARRIHKTSGRKGRFVPVSCIAIPSSLMESELFGYARGAFTGANEDRDGLFLAADKGTLFLDEIGEMPLEMQVKLLRVLEESSVRPLGATKPVSADVRLIFATNKDLEDEVRRGAFREDLFYRISVIPINIPPLRERREDVPALVEHFLGQSGRSKDLEKDALDSLEQYDWPGNVRELRNELLRLTAISKGKIEKHMVKDDIINPRAPASTETLEEIERKVIHDVLQKTEFDTRETARLLGIARSTLYEKMKRYGIKRTES